LLVWLPTTSLHSANDHFPEILAFFYGILLFYGVGTARRVLLAPFIGRVIRYKLTFVSKQVNLDFNGFADSLELLQ
jgi:hypothetical protein